MILTFKGRWNAVTNTATLESGTIVNNALQDGSGTTGDCYIIYANTTSVHANIYNRDLGSGTKSWIALSYIYYDGSIWTMVGSGGGGTGTVTLVDTQLPLQGGPITSTGTISIPPANITDDGYLSSSDWNIFNNKADIPINLATQVTGNLATSHLNSGTSASSSTFWRGDGTWATPIDTTGTVTPATISGITGSRLIGRYSASTGTGQEISIGPSLGLNSSTGVLDIGAAIGTTGNVLTDTGSAWTSSANTGGWTLYVTSGDFTSGSTTAQDIPGFVTASLAINTVYEFECMFSMNTPGNANGVKYAVGSTQSLTFCSIWFSGAAGGNTASTTVIGTANTLSAIGFMTASSTEGIMIIKGWIKSGANAPVLSIQYAKTTAGTVTIRSGGILRIRKIV